MKGFLIEHQTERGRRKFSIAPISFDYETDATATGASPEPYEKINF